jgi:hypothetical protein
MFMEEKNYYDILSSYRKGTEFMLVTDRKNGEVSNFMYLDYLPDEKNELKPKLRFVNGGAVFEPESIGGIEKIVSLNIVDDQQC